MEGVVKRGSRDGAAHDTERGAGISNRLLGVFPAHSPHGAIFLHVAIPGMAWWPKQITEAAGIRGWPSVERLPGPGSGSRTVMGPSAYVHSQCAVVQTHRLGTTIGRGGGPCQKLGGSPWTPVSKRARVRPSGITSSPVSAASRQQRPESRWHDPKTACLRPRGGRAQRRVARSGRTSGSGCGPTASARAWETTHHGPKTWGVILPMMAGVERRERPGSRWRHEKLRPTSPSPTPYGPSGIR